MQRPSTDTCSSMAVALFKVIGVLFRKFQKSLAEIWKFSLILLEFDYSNLEMTLNDPEFGIYIFPVVDLVETNKVQKVHPNRTLR